MPFTRLLVVAGFVLAVGLGMGLSARADEKEKNRAARVAVLEMAGNLGCDDLARQLVDEHDLCDIMDQFKPRTKGGIGIGKVAPPGFRDGIELTIHHLANDKNGFTKYATDNYRLELIHLAQQAQAIAEINAYTRIHKGGRLDQAAYTRMNDEMKASAAELVKAATARDAVAVKTAARRLANCCLECHRVEE
jgi:hypothetical protein